MAAGGDEEQAPMVVNAAINETRKKKELKFAISRVDMEIDNSTYSDDIYIYTYSM